MKYKFRGKTEDDMIFEDGTILDKGIWVYGSLIENEECPYIVGNVVESDTEYIALEYWYPCDKDTIGQFTGLKDKKLVEIYDDDIISVVCDWSLISRDSTNSFNEVRHYQIESHNHRLMAKLLKSGINGDMMSYPFEIVDPIYHDLVDLGDDIEVIGNMYEVKE